jgi:hypothetical protein
MPWRCPACRTVIEHKDAEERPRLDVLYRCHLCRLDLTLDALSGRLTEARNDPDPRPERHR